MENAFRLATEPKTRRNLTGPYFDDWFYVLQHIQWNRWSDGDKWFTSKIAHPAQGTVTAWIFRLNNENAQGDLDFRNRAYRKMLLKAFITASVVEFWFKLGPFSEATIGHVGLHTDPRTGTNRTGLNDYVTNEAVGVPIMIGEDWLDRHVAIPVENRSTNRALIDTVRIFASPTRSFIRQSQGISQTLAQGLATLARPKPIVRPPTGLNIGQHGQATGDVKAADADLNIGDAQPPRQIHATSSPSTRRSLQSSASPFSTASVFDGITERSHWMT